MLVAIKDVFERFVFDPSLVDLVLWYPHLGWHDFLVSAATVLAWRIISDRMERFLSFHLRRTCSFWLLRLALWVRPQGTPFARPVRQSSALAMASRQAMAGVARRWA